ncbi:MAG: diguanylate cyclase [Deltaproteobacteria bacterium]|nr:diguanylate cyclase [Deltaproteobacteria bacterium]
MKSWLSRWTGLPPEPENSTLVEERFAELPFACEHSSGIAVPNRQKILRQLYTCCQHQLQMLQQMLQLTSAVILWSGPEPGQLSLYASSSRLDQLQIGPYPSGIGITGALKEHDELALVPVTEFSPAIPYYTDHRQTGSFMAVKLLVSAAAGSQQNDSGLLCVDRESTEAWTAVERTLIAETAEQLADSVAVSRQLFVYDRERHAYRRAFDGLRKLNAALGLQSTFSASADAIKTIVPADFFSISLATGDQHCVSYVLGDNAEKLAGQAFPIEQGLVGQVMKYRRTLPDNADYKGTSPVFSPAHLFADYHSLLVIPLLQEDGPVIGAMIVAAKQANMFTRTCREMLELVATQVMIKIELARSHEQINRLATIDALTGIANRRAYQCGFEAMLDRARRRSGSLYLILCDIDHFKQINDRFGHPFGDEVLQQVAKLFARVIRSVDLAARTGGEEFAILLEDTEKEGAWTVAERLRTLVTELTLRSDRQPVPVAISLGIAAFPEDANSMEKLVSCADRALYRAKAEGRNRTVVWSPDV